MSDSRDRDDRVPAWRRYLRFWRSDPRGDVDDEIGFHIESLVAQLTAGGMSEPEARRVAQRRFGDVRTIAGDMVALVTERERTMQRADWLDAISRDARYAARQLVHRPGFTAVVIATLALAIGANTAIFSAVNAVILRPLPVAGLDRVHVVKMNLPGIGLMDTELSPGQTEDLFGLDVVEAGAGYAAASLVLNGVGEARRLSTVRTLGQFFAMTGAGAQIGRLFRPQESEEGSHRVVVLSHTFWQQVFGGDAAIVGRTVDLNGAPFEVVGVMSPDAGFPRSADIWVPLMMNTARRTDPAERGRLYVTAVLRVRPGTTGQQLDAALDREAVRIQREYQRSTTDFTVIPFVSFLAGELRLVLVVLLGAVGLVLLIACANVGSIQLVRASARAREMAVRSALGAGREAIVRQLLVESLVLALAGAAVGLLLGKLTIGVLGRVASERYPQLGAAQLDGATLLFTLAVTLVAGLLFGLLPALRAARMNLNDALKSGAGPGRSSTRQQHRLLEGSIVVQVALTLMLLLGSVLTVRSFERLLAVDPGFRSQGVFTAKISVPGSKYRSVRLADAMSAIVERSAAIPGVHAAAAVFGLPFSGDNDSSPFEIVNQPKQQGDPERHAEYRVVSGDYFRAMGIPVLRGRTFTPDDRGGAANVVLIDERLAKQYFGDVDPVGRRVTHLGSPTGNVWTIAGVVGAVMRNELGEEHKATIYYHLPQVPWYSQMALVLRSDLPPAQLAGPLRAAVREFDPDIPVHDLRPMQARVEASVGARRLATIVMSGFALLSFALAVLGVYGVISYGTTQRTREIGIRMALGARPSAVSRMVLASGVGVAAVGILAGLLLFLAAARVLDALLYGVGARDPLTMVGGAAVVAMAAALASYLPARRAAAVDPVEALKG